MSDMYVDKIKKEENLYTPNCIRTFTGIYIDIFDPVPEMINIEDIAHSLSMQTRFGGHLPEFYSVAQHCIGCCTNVDSEYKLEALLHDASEAYLMDIPSPIKNRLSNYKEIEHRLMSVISDVFKFNYPLSKTVKRIDEAMLVVEWEYIMLQKEHQLFKRLSQQQAKGEFIKLFNLYSKL